MKIVTHVSPDWDAIGAVWLITRYHRDFASAEVVYVNTGNPDPVVLASADAVVDTGRVLNPATLRFDHHQLPGASANATCATELVFDHLGSAPPAAIRPLIGLIYAGDTGQPDANESRQIGIHALLSAKKATRADDLSLLAYGFDILDTLASGLVAQSAARAALAAHTVYASGDGLVVALKDAPQGATFAAHDAGARLVVFADYARNAIGVMRGGEARDPDVGALVQRIIDSGAADNALGAVGGQTYAQIVADELATWFCHNAGFFAGRGTAKAPRADAITIDLIDLSRAIDTTWERSAP